MGIVDGKLLLSRMRGLKITAMVFSSTLFVWVMSIVGAEMAGYREIPVVIGYFVTTLLFVSLVATAGLAASLASMLGRSAILWGLGTFIFGPISVGIVYSKMKDLVKEAVSKCGVGA